jgi:membrane protein
MTALWSASAGTKALISAINIAYDARDERSYVVKRAVALLVTFCIIILGLALAGAIAFLPQILNALGFDDDAISLMELARWPTIFVLVVLGLGALYKLAPNRPLSASPLLNWGAASAAVGWLLATVGLAIYVDNFSSLPETYGTLTGIVVAMLWFFTSGMVILAGAELNSELEQRQAYSARRKQGGGPVAA